MSEVAKRFDSSHAEEGNDAAEGSGAAASIVDDNHVVGGGIPCGERTLVAALEASV